MTDKRHLIVVDVETTGLDVNNDWPLEVAAINVTTGQELYFVPDLPQGALDNANGKALQINRYFERGVYARRLSKTDSDNRWRELWEMLAGNTLAGSNPTFDAAMLNRGYCWSNKTFGGESPWHHRLADLAAYAAPALHLAPNQLAGLADVCKKLGVELIDPHCAMADAQATAECFRILTDRYTSAAVSES